MVATARITIRVFVTFSACKESNVTKLSRERCEVYLNLPYAVTIETRVKNWKATIFESRKAEQNTVKNQKVLSWPSS